MGVKSITERRVNSRRPLTCEPLHWCSCLRCCPKILQILGAVTLSVLPSGSWLEQWIPADPRSHSLEVCGSLCSSTRGEDQCAGNPLICVPSRPARPVRLPQSACVPSTRSRALSVLTSQPSHLPPCSPSLLPHLLPLYLLLLLGQPACPLGWREESGVRAGCWTYLCFLWKRMLDLVWHKHINLTRVVILVTSNFKANIC